MRITVGLGLVLFLTTAVGAQELPVATLPATPEAQPSKSAKLDCSQLRNYVKCLVKAQADGIKEVGQALREGRVPNVTVAVPPNSTGGAASGVPVYGASQCIGAIVNGACHGTIMPNGTQPKRCYGEMINGTCTGPMF